MPSLHHIARQTHVVSCRVNWVGPTCAFCVGVRPAVALRRPTHSDTEQTQNAPVWRSDRLSSHLHTRRDKTVLSVAVWIGYCAYYALLFLSLIPNRCVTTWRHSQNRKYITYCMAAWSGAAMAARWLIDWLIDWLSCGFVSHSTQTRGLINKTS